MLKIAFFSFLAVGSCSANRAVDAAFRGFQVVPQVLPLPPKIIATVSTPRLNKDRRQIIQLSRKNTSKLNKNGR